MGRSFLSRSATVAAEIGGEAVLLSVIRDITERKRAEEALHLQATIAAHISEGVNLVRASDGVIVYANAKTEEMFGYGPGEMIGIHVSVLNAPMDNASPSDTAREIMDTLEQSGGWKGEVQNVKKDGTGFWCLASVAVYDHAEFGRVLITIQSDITKRKRAEEALRESEQRFALFMQNLPGVAVIRDFEGRYVYLNEAWDKAMGLCREDYIGKTPLETFPREDALRLLEDDRRVIQSGETIVTEVQLHHSSGARWWLVNRFPLQGAEGRPAHVAGLYVDITERKRAEEALRESEERFKSLFNNALLGLYRTTPDGEVLMANPALCRMLGYASPEEMKRRNLEEEGFQPDYNRAEFKREIEEKGVIMGLEAGWRRTDGTILFIRESARAVRDAEEKTLYYEGTVENITDRRQAEQAMRESEARYRSLFERNLAGVYRSTPEGQLLDCNDAFARIFGYGSAAEILALPSAENLYPEPDARKAFIERLRSAGSLRNLSSEGRRKDASPVWLLENVALIRDETRGEEILEGTCIDITDQKQAQEKQRLLSTAVEQSHETIMVTDREGRIVYANPAFERITGYGRAEVLGRTPRVLKSGVHGPAFYEEMWRTILAGQVWAGRITNRRKDGKLYEEHTIISPVRDAAGAVTAFVAAKRDVTQEAKLEERLREAKRLETVGMIAGGVAHEVRNPLFAITTIVTALARKLADQPEFSEYVVHIQDQSRRLNLLMEDLLTLGRPIDPAQFERLDLRDVLAETKAVVAAGGVDAGAFVFERGKEPLEVLGIASQDSSRSSRTWARTPSPSPRPAARFGSARVVRVSGPSSPAPMTVREFRPNSCPVFSAPFRPSERAARAWGWRS